MRYIKPELSWLLVGVFAAIMLGMLVGNTMLFISMYLAAFLIFQGIQFVRFVEWYLMGPHSQPISLTGVWNILIDKQFRRYRTQLKRKHSVKELVSGFKKVSRALPNGTIILDKNNAIVWMNTLACDMFELKKRQDLGRVISNLVRSTKLIDYLIEEVFDEPIDIESPIDASKNYRIHISPYADNKLMTIRDISKVMQLQQMRRDFVGNISHELRTPLTIIQGYVDMLSMDQRIPEEIRGLHLKILQQSGHMHVMLEDLLKLNRLETIELNPADMSLINMSDLVNSLIDQIEMMPKGADIDYQVDVDPHFSLIGIQSEIHSVCLNLLSNALRYTPPAGCITVRWYVDDDRVLFEVEDNGEGIEAAHIPRLTERFYRSHADRSRESGGTGLGLAIVKHVLQRHDAHLEIESEVGVGSLFRCVFPLRSTVYSKSKSA